MNSMFPFFLLNIRKDDAYHIFNPVDNRQYTVNYKGYRILEHCDGKHSTPMIAGIIAREFNDPENEALDYVSEFLSDMTKYGMVSWRDREINAKSEEKPPETVFWDITAHCNLRCIHCYYDTKSNNMVELSTDQIKRIIDELAVYDVTNLVFSGGEIFLRKDAMEIIIHATDNTFSDVSISTNGTLVNSQIAKELSKHNVNVQVSIDGHNASLHDSIRGVEGSFKSAIHGIKLLQAENIPVSTCTVATKMNVERIPEIIELMNDLHIEYYRVQGLMPVGRGRTNDNKLSLTPSRMKQLVEYLESQSIQISSYNFTLKDPPLSPADMNGTGACAAATSSCSITPGGNVVPCVHFWGSRADNLRNHTFRWIWENSDILRYFRSISLGEVKGFCRDCNWLALCHGGCKAENYLTGDIFGSNHTCWVADAYWRSSSEKKV